ncbi:hypothetical protein [Dyella choica]|uniref:Uncharacterized protein n=1 Tax=Dyella choica TaxID=1927959 RepID=A0A432M4D3_9GAMM|nr:hypothetical protein [Dyella choica]RUL74069.1 hypothetical protein EKH80_14670 [Dyella choica]
MTASLNVSGAVMPRMLPAGKPLSRFMLQAISLLKSLACRFDALIRRAKVKSSLNHISSVLT